MESEKSTAVRLALRAENALVDLVQHLDTYEPNRGRADRMQNLAQILRIERKQLARESVNGTD